MQNKKNCEDISFIKFVHGWKNNVNNIQLLIKITTYVLRMLKNGERFKHILELAMIKLIQSYLLCFIMSP
jgi:hypothetical protein